MTLYSRDAAERLLAIATKATNIVETDSAHLAQLAETIIALYDRLAAPPRIIRTLADLEVLDPDTILVPGGWGDSWTVEEISATSDAVSFLPAVVIATGDQIRAARQALKEVADATD